MCIFCGDYDYDDKPTRAEAERDAHEDAQRDVRAGRGPAPEVPFMRIEDFDPNPALRPGAVPYERT